jgi:hypothetical protein
MPALKEPKSQEKRISECLAILKRLTDEVGIPASNPTIRTLKKRMSVYWREGKLQEDSLPLFGYNRSVMYKLPKWEHQEVEVTLRINNFTVRKHPDDLQTEIEIYKLEKNISDTEAYAIKRMEEIGAVLLPEQPVVDAPRHQQPTLSATVSATHPQPLSYPAAAASEQTNSATQSDPSHPSPPA